MISIQLVVGVSLLYIAFLFLIAYYADRKQEYGKSIISNPHIYTLSITVFVTTLTYYGSIGYAANSGIKSLYILIGPSLVTCLWWGILRKIVRISKENNITSVADFISSRYGKSQWLGALVTIIAMLGVMPYIALQLRAVSSSFNIICASPTIQIPFLHGTTMPQPSPGYFAALIMSIFAIIFGARHLVSSERHEGIVAAIAIESVVKLTAFLIIGMFTTYVLFDGISDIFTRFRTFGPLFQKLTTFDNNTSNSNASIFTMLLLSMSATIFLPRQFHIMVIENSSEDHIKQAMWRFPAYLLLISIFVMPIALGGIIYTGSNAGADFFVLTLPMKSGHKWLALTAFLGGFSAATGMVIVESVAISTMFLNHLVMPIMVRLKPRSWFSILLINLKRFGIFIIIFLGYLYYEIVGDTLILMDMGLISFAATAQFAPAFLGGLYWHRGNKSGAITGLVLGFITWFYTLLVPSIVKSGWWQSEILEKGPFGLHFFRPTELFGLTGFDIWSNSLFWSMFFNIGGYVVCSIIFSQGEVEKEQVSKFVDVFKPAALGNPWETKRLTKSVTIMEFVNLMTKFIGESQSRTAIAEYLGSQEISEQGGVSEFELPKLKRFVEKTLAGSLGGAAAGAIVESYLSDIGSKMESVYDIFSTVRSELSESREALSVRLMASEIMNRTMELSIIMDDLIGLIHNEFKFDLVVIRLIDEEGKLVTRSFIGTQIASITDRSITPEKNTYLGDAILSNKPSFLNDTRHITKVEIKEMLEREGIRSFAHIPINSESKLSIGVLSVYSRSIIGLFTKPFLDLLMSLTGQLAQAIKLDEEIKIREQEKKKREKSEIARKVQSEYLRKKQYAEFSIVRHLTHNLKPKIQIAKSPIKVVRRFLDERHLCDEVLAKHLDGTDETIREALNSSIKSLEQMTSVLDSARQVVVSEINPKDFEVLDICKVFRDDILPIWNNGKFKINLVCSEVFANIHRHSFIEAINNLVRNAEVHGFRDSSKGNMIEFAISEDEYYIVIDYTNNGLPFPKNMDENDFLSFGKKSVESPGEGLGGAWIAKAIDAHHGMFQIIRDKHPVHFRILLPKEEVL